MAALLITDTQRYIGTAAERAGVTPTKAGATFYETDTKLTYIWNGSAWVLFAPASVPGSGAVNFSTFTAGDTTPSIAGGSHFKTANTGATTITDFDDPSAGGHEITIVFGDTDTTIQASASIVLQGGQASPANDFGASAILDTIKLLYDGTRWVELHRSLNS